MTSDAAPARRTATRRQAPRRKPATNPPVRGPLSFRYDDGGRREAGFKGRTGDCVVRAISIATGLPYGEVYRELRRRSAAKGRPSPRHGVHRSAYRPYLEELGWTWVPTMGIGTGTTVHLAKGELPEGKVIARVSRHLVAVDDWVIRDTHDCGRGGTRAVYGWFEPATEDSSATSRAAVA